MKKIVLILFILTSISLFGQKSKYIFLEGVITDSLTEQAINTVSITVETCDKNGEKLIIQETVDGIFKIKKGRKCSYTLTIKKEGYQTIILPSESIKPKKIKKTLVYSISLLKK